MLSKRVKQRRKHNRALRKWAGKGPEARLAIKAVRQGSVQFLLSQKHFVVCHPVDDSDYGRNLVRKMAEAEQRRRAVFASILDSDTPVVQREELPELEQQKLALFDKFAEHNPDAWQSLKKD